MKTVMIVDDSTSVRDYCRAELEADGYRVVLARDGVEALEKLLPRPPDVIVLDLRMGRMGGLETALRIRSIQPHIPIIVFTATHQDWVASCFGPLIDACVQKSEDLSELKRAIWAAVTRSLFTRRPAPLPSSPFPD